MGRLRARAVAFAVIVAMASGCWIPRKEIKSQTLNVVSDPPGAQIQIEDVKGIRDAGKAPGKVEVLYEANISHFQQWSWIEPVLGVGLTLFFGPTLLQYFGGQKSADKDFAGFMIADIGTSAGITSIVHGLPACIIGSIVREKPQPSDEAIKEGARKMGPFASAETLAAVEKELNATAYSQVKLHAKLPGYYTEDVTLDRPPTSKTDLRLTLYPERAASPPVYAPPQPYPQQPYPQQPYPTVPPPVNNATPPPPPAGPHSCRADVECPGDLVCNAGQCTGP